MTRVLTSTEDFSELEQLLRRRTALGLDHRDEMWEGVLHMVPPAGGAHQALSGRITRLLYDRAESCGLCLAYESGLFDPADPVNRWRVPDLVVARPELWTERGLEGPAALVVEIRSPGDESFAKLPFYAEMGVGQVLIIEPDDLAFTLLRLAGTDYADVEDGCLDPLDATMARVADAHGVLLRFTWPGGGGDVRPGLPSV